MNDRDQVFPSKIDAWLALVIAGSVGGMWLSLAQRIWTGRPTDMLDVVVPVLISAFVVWICRTTYYVVTPDTLIVRCGPLRRTVPLGSVQRLRATHNPLSSPALSLDRIEVTYGSRRVLISPRDKRAFVNAIAERAPAVVMEGVHR